MANPLDLLPLIDGNTYSFINQDLSETVSPGQEKKVSLAEEVERGFYFGTVTTIVGQGGQDMELSITVDDFRADTTPQEMYESGFVNPLGIAPGVSRYDTDNDVYTAIHNPQRPIGFNDVVNFTQRAPNDGDNLAVDASIFSIGITEPRQFVRQYLELVNPSILIRDDLELREDDLDKILERFR